MRGLFKILFGATFGVLYGLFFAQKSGKKLRSELGKSENPLQRLAEELKKVGSESLDWAENCPELQKILTTGRAQFDELSKSARHLTVEQKKAAQKKLHELSENAKQAAEEIGGTLSDKAEDFKNKAKEKAADLSEAASEKAGKFRNQIEEGTRKIASKVAKK